MLLKAGAPLYLARHALCVFYTVNPAEGPVQAGAFIQRDAEDVRRNVEEHAKGIMAGIDAA